MRPQKSSYNWWNWSPVSNQKMRNPQQIADIPHSTIGGEVASKQTDLAFRAI